MFRRNRLPDSLQWRAVGWMEIGLSQADAARLLNVSHSLVHRLLNQFQTTDSASRRSVPGLPRVTTSSEERCLALSVRKVYALLYLSSLLIILSHREGPQSLQSEDAFIMQVYMQDDHLCVSV